MIPVSKCVGCRDDFYNHRGEGTGRCWAAKDGRIITRYRIYYMTAPTQPRAFEQVKAPSCFHQANNYIYYNALPNFVKASDVVRSKRKAVRP